MTLAIPPAGIVRLALSGTYQATRWANIFHVYVPSLDPSSGAEVTDLSNDLQDAFTSSLFYDAQANDFALNAAALTCSDGSALFGYEFPWSIEGTDDSGGHINGGTAVCVSWQGSWHYRGGKPRNYIGGLTDAWVVEPSVLEPGRVTSLRNAALALIANIAALSGSYGSVVVLGALIGNTASSPGTFAPYSGAVVQDTPRSQRRRNHGH